jgi:hypothetical protein
MVQGINLQEKFTKKFRSILMVSFVVFGQPDLDRNSGSNFPVAAFFSISNFVAGGFDDFDIYRIFSGNVKVNLF